jgi:SAM-dependent methyltransferase
VSVALDQVVPWGRSLDEYRGMFSLSDADLGSRILGCGDGPASFNAEMHRLGRRILSVDPIYAFTADQIESRVRATYDTIISQVKRRPENFLWTRFADPDDLGRARLAAMRTFLADYPAGKRDGRYLPASLPALPLADGSFDLAVVSHLLFLYADQLSLDFHLAAVRDLCRVAAEVRIFPLLDLACRPSAHLGPVAQRLSADGLSVTIEPVAYEFQRGGDRMMRVRSPRRIGP